MKTLEILENLKNTNSRLEKEKIIENAWDKDCLEFFQAVKMAYDPLMVFNVQKVPEITEDDPSVNITFKWEDFLILAEKLKSREITGNNARDALYNAASCADMDEWNNLMRRVLLKDLRVGISETTVNKVLKRKAKINKKANDYILNKFGCQLADKLQDGSELYGNYYVDIKLDGVRCLTFLNKENNTVQQFSRIGKPFYNFSYITKGLEKVLEELPGSIVLDGEIISETFQELMTQVHRKENVDANDSKYAIFDIIPLEEFNNDNCKKTQKERNEVLCELIGLFQKHLNDKVFILDKKIIDFGEKNEEPPEEFKQFLADTVSSGYEGVIVKNPNGIYKNKRSKDWLKWKPNLTIDLEVIDFEKGTGKNSEKLGNIICFGYENEKPIKVSVGSGFSDEQRQEFWDNKEKLKNQIVEIMADSITKDKNDDEFFSLRFPRFIRFRGFAQNEKL